MTRLAAAVAAETMTRLVAPKGKLPKFSMQQITPPAMVIRNDNPKLAVEPTVVVPPQVKLASAAALNFGDPKSALPAGPASNGTGMGGGIGSGSGGGIGSGTGPGVGPGFGGGIGGGVFRVGGGVSAPRVLENPSPDYSEEARKAKYQGTVVLWLIVDSNGKPRDVTRGAQPGHGTGPEGNRGGAPVEIPAGDEGWHAGGGSDQRGSQFPPVLTEGSEAITTPVQVR